jgi:K+-sensing histidine kinase KdpD
MRAFGTGLRGWVDGLLWPLRTRTERPFASNGQVHFATTEFALPIVILAVITGVGLFLPITYHAMGHVYLLAVLAISMHVGRGPAVFVAIASALAWNCVFMPPRFSFRIDSFDDGLLLATYFVVALSGSYWTARSREQQLAEHAREREAQALLQLIQAFTGANGFDEGVRLAVQQTEHLFGVPVAISFADPDGPLRWHAASTAPPPKIALDSDHTDAEGVFVLHHPGAKAVTIAAPLRRGREPSGWLALRGGSTFELSAAGARLLAGVALQLGVLHERERLRTAAEQQALLKKSNQLHRTLLDSISHELNTPLAVLRSAAEEWGSPDAAKHDLLANEIRVATSRLNRLMGNLVHRSRLESGPLQPKFDWCDAHDLFHSARVGAADLLEGRPVVVDIPPDMPLVYTDPVLMDQVLINLVSNAARHTPAGLPIRLRAATDADEVRLSVIDRGRGVPPSLRSQVFDKFRRGDDARPGGLGLGLSIAHALVEAQHGALRYDDEPGGGARFSVSLPLKENEEVPADEC